MKIVNSWEDYQNQAPLPTARLAERLGVADQLGCVPLCPALDVVLNHEAADPARTVLRAGDVAWQPVRQVGDPGDQRHAERRGPAR